MEETAMEETAPVKRSYLAMVLSAILPGVGQIYLNQYAKAFFILLGVVSAIFIFVVNSLPLENWSDLLLFRRHGEAVSTTGTGDSEPERITYLLWTFDNGKTLAFHPSWKLKISSLIQAVLCWVYAVYDGWRGIRGTKKVQQ